VNVFTNSVWLHACEFEYTFLGLLRGLLARSSLKHIFTLISNFACLVSFASSQPTADGLISQTPNLNLT